ncbi:transcription factor LHW-like [Euphorbia lathyris]|uniref:transcription factor LHW-like n=1 Tax=Euphorbia lathyris TaxID=212925 RepID=UPI003313CA21
MGTTALRQLLKSLCSNSAWNYAVLWKLRHGNPVILSWEDGYFNYPTTRKFEETVSDDVCCKDASYIISPDFETNISSGNSEDYSIGLLAADMSCLQYALGEGVVGKVASTRDHSWVSLNDIFTGAVECPDEWLLQFASGIKTILLIPVLPHGVLQLGSLEEVSEDINIIVSVKSELTSLHSVQWNTMPLSLEGSEAQLSSSFESYPIENSDAQLSTVLTSVKTENLEPLEPVSAFELESDYPFVTNRDVMLLTVQDASMPAFHNFPEAFNYGTENMVDVPSTESKLLDLSSLMEELHTSSDFYDYSGGFCGESFNQIMNSYPIDSLPGEMSIGKGDSDISNGIRNSCLRLTEESELHKATRPTTEKQPNEIFWDSTFLAKDAPNTNKSPTERTELSWFARGPDAGYLLEDVVAKANTSIDNNTSVDNSYSISKNFVSCNSFSGSLTAWPKPHKRSNSSSPPSYDSIPWSQLTSESTDVRTANSTPDSFESMMNTMLRKEQQSGDSDDMKPLKGCKTSNTSKRRAKPGDNQKPRPRDRQLIQDRVKELRELVPNGAKCSIDSLLDRTVNHMVYLRSVADQAEKLRQCAPQKLDGSANGTSRAIEFGNEFLQCPIVVEDLGYPGCMLIEVLCNDDGVFLEVADIIHGLHLTILKGVQESRSGNTWARYIVEVSDGFHRLDIFWPLVQLLQRKRKPISSRI